MKRAKQLLPKIADPENLREAFLRAARGKRGKLEVIRFREGLSENLAELRSGILDGTVQLGQFHSFVIQDPKERTIHAAAFSERVLHHAIMRVCEPVFERVSIDDSYACRVGKGSLAAVERARYFARRYPWYLQMDVRKYFDSIDHACLKAAFRRKFAEPALLSLFDRIIDSYETAPGRGLPIGSLSSQHFANFYLMPLDRFVKETLRLKYMRYMDDLVCWAEDKASLRQAKSAIEAFAEQALRLKMKPQSQLQRSEHGLNFLGYRVLPTKLRLSRRSAVRFRRKLRELDHFLNTGQLNELAYQQRVGSLCAFTQGADAVAFRKRWIWGDDSRARTALTAAAVGTTTRRTAVPPIATGTRRATATTTSASASPSAQAGHVETRH